MDGLRAYLPLFVGRGLREKTVISENYADIDYLGLRIFPVKIGISQGLVKNS